MIKTLLDLSVFQQVTFFRYKVKYTYDENGNLTQDLNRNIKDIQYNFLNLPQRIEFGDGSTTEYLYDAIYYIMNR